jgi:tetratricopeptide (TPR) repeat protein
MLPVRQQAIDNWLEPSQVPRREKTFGNILEDARQFDLIFLYAEAQARSGDTGKAMAMLSRFGADSPVASAAVAKQAEILFTLGDEDEANRRIEELTSSADFDDLMLAAEVFQRLEKYDEAIPILERAVAVRADSIQAMFWLGASYERTGRRGEATSMLEALLEVSPDFAPALNYLGYMWAEIG